VLTKLHTATGSYARQCCLHKGQHVSSSKTLLDWCPESQVTATTPEILYDPGKT